ncbi:MAG: glycosyl hydrolase, partial [Bacteroidota bacterium]
GTAYIATTRYKFNDLRPAIYRTTDYGKSWQKITTGIPKNTYVRVVREDPIREGLLFAGTETGMYVSYDTGKQWEPLQLNLPVTPITDLKIHQGDLIVATSGRSFWVLDDLEALRQFQAETIANRLLQPADVYRLSARGGMNSNRATGTSSTTGVNPASGAVIYYELTEEQAEKGALLQITTADGEVVRSFSSEKDTDFQSYAGGPSPEPVIDSKKGLNRFVWNLRHPTLQGAPKAYLEGSYAGRRVVPGVYTARLLSLAEDGDESPVEIADAVSFQVLPHPELDLPLSAYETQDEMMQAVGKRINEIHGAVNDLAKLRKRIKERTKDLKQDKNSNEKLYKIGKGLIKELTDWESELIQRKSQAYDDVINFPNKLSAEYLFLKGQMDTNTPNVTTPMQERLKELDTSWLPLKAKQAELLAAIDSFEQALLTAGIKVLR